MGAPRFIGDADYPHVIDRANDGTKLPDRRGWRCDACGTLYADLATADVCGIEPDAVK
jgi:rubrerythrin